MVEQPQNAEDPLAETNRYQKVRTIGVGAFGRVLLAYDSFTAEYVAIKLLHRGGKVTKYTSREILNHRRLNHPHIIQLIEVFLTSKYLAIVMEYAPGGDLYHYVLQRRGLPEDDARWFFQQLVIALEFCHRMGVVSRDLKLENTLLDDSPRPLIKLCDFGYSKHELLQSAPGSRVGTPAYLAPEVIVASKEQTYDGKISDIWSVGVMLYVMVSARYPFRHPDDESLPPSSKLHAMLKRIMEARYDLPPSVPLSVSCRDLLGRMLVANPAQRITVQEIMQHPWFLQNLPQGVVDMNTHLLPDDVTHVPEHFPGQQSVSELSHILQEAMTVGEGTEAGASHGPPISLELPVHGIMQEQH